MKAGGARGVRGGQVLARTETLEEENKKLREKVAAQTAMVRTERERQREEGVS